MVPHSKLASKSPNNPLAYRGMPAQKGHNVSPSGVGICNTNCGRDGSESEAPSFRRILLFYFKQLKAEYILIVTGNV